VWLNKKKKGPQLSRSSEPRAPGMLECPRIIGEDSLPFVGYISFFSNSIDGIPNPPGKTFYAFDRQISIGLMPPLRPFSRKSGHRVLRRSNIFPAEGEQKGAATKYNLGVGRLGFFSHSRMGGFEDTRGKGLF